MTRSSVSSALIGRVSSKRRDVFEVDRAVRIVLEDHEVVPPWRVEQLAPALRAHQQAGRILEVRRDVDELRGPALLSPDPRRRDRPRRSRCLRHPAARRPARPADCETRRSRRCRSAARRSPRSPGSISTRPDQIEALLRSAGDDDVFEARADAARAAACARAGARSAAGSRASRRTAACCRRGARGSAR